MIKFYLSTVVIWFIITIMSHIIFHKQFIKSQEKIRKETNNNSKKYGFIKTTILYFFISFIPIIRLFALIAFYITIANPKKMIEIIKDNEEEEND